MKQDMKDEIGDPVYQDWEAFSQKTYKDIEERQKKVDEYIKLIEESDPCHREELRKEIEQLKFEIPNLILKHYMAITPTIAYIFNKANNISVN